MFIKVIAWTTVPDVFAQQDALVLLSPMLAVAARLLPNNVQGLHYGEDATMADSEYCENACNLKFLKFLKFPKSWKLSGKFPVDI